MNEKTEDTNAPDMRTAVSGMESAVNASAKADEDSWGSFAWFVIKLALAVLIFRSFIFSPFSIPSESMLPRLWNGDYLVAAKWPYGFSKYSLPFSAPIIPGRVFASEPERGDVVIFKHPIDGTDYIKRVIALVRDETAEGDITCRYAQFRETLPSGVSFNTLDFGETLADNYAPKIVPQGRLFVMGDNRDNSQDSRFPAQPQGGVGFVPQDLLVGEASMIMWSTDGGAEWIQPWTWFSAARWQRMLGSI